MVYHERERGIDCEGYSLFGMLNFMLLYVMDYY